MWKSIRKLGDNPRGVCLTQNLTTAKPLGNTKENESFKEGLEAEDKQTLMLQGPPLGIRSYEGEISVESNLPSRSNNLNVLNQIPGKPGEKKQTDKNCCCLRLLEFFCCLQCLSFLSIVSGTYLFLAHLTGCCSALTR